MDALCDIAAPDHRHVDWLGRYCARIGWRERHVSGIASLSQIMLAHVESFPFDMLDYFLGTPPTIEIEIILRKFLLGGRGGGCSQQNAILHTMLGQLGVGSRLGMARVVRTDGRRSPRAHMILFIEMEGRHWLCDGGYGVFGPVQPVLIEPGLIQRQGELQFIITPSDGDFLTLSRLSNGSWKPIYQFDRRTYDLQDFAPANFYNSLSPHSPFTRNLIVGRPSLTGGVMIRNNVLIKIEGADHTRQRVKSLAHLVELLAALFSIVLREEDFVHAPPGFTPLEATG